jgi:hypothetical protein
MDPQTQRTLAADLFNYTWTLIEKPERTERETDLMIDSAHASRFFWESVGEAVNHARGEWQISRAYAEAKRPEPCLYHARRCLEICEAHSIGGFDLAYAYEAIARAHLIAGEKDEATDWARRGREEAATVADPEDRAHVLKDFAGL